jgi:hypothetical protein
VEVIPLAAFIGVLNVAVVARAALRARPIIDPLYFAFLTAATNLHFIFLLCTY